MSIRTLDSQALLAVYLDSPTLIPAITILWLNAMTGFSAWAGAAGQAAQKSKSLQLVKSIMKESVISELPRLMQSGFTETVYQKCMVSDRGRPLFGMMDGNVPCTLDPIKLTEKIQMLDFAITIRDLTIKCLIFHKRQSLLTKLLVL
jgi:hypothetical protein